MSEGIYTESNLPDLPDGWSWARANLAWRKSDHMAVYPHPDQDQYPGYWTDHRGNVFRGGVLEACELHDTWKAREPKTPWWARAAEWLARRAGR